MLEKATAAGGAMSVKPFTSAKGVEHRLRTHLTTTPKSEHDFVRLMMSSIWLSKLYYFNARAPSVDDGVVGGRLRNHPKVAFNTFASRYSSSLILGIGVVPTDGYVHRPLSVRVALRLARYSSMHVRRSPVTTTSLADDVAHSRDRAALVDHQQDRRRKCWAMMGPRPKIEVQAIETM